jgi:diaminohydroxyphosphoribosylaminopyrimidine deaminase / 5-amino-6-(5-phosphoribosylamino)uracil reductase
MYLEHSACAHTRVEYERGPQVRTWKQIPTFDVLPLMLNSKHFDSPLPLTSDPRRDPFAMALTQAELALRGSNPNPRVGCVIASSEGSLVGAGHTQRVGAPHAEVMALRDAGARGHDLEGATAFVTLEPCSHHGRTPPCCDALIDAGIAKVIVATIDPNPKVAGRGIQRLREAGVSVDVLPADSDAARASRELNIGFFSRMVRGRPWVRLKVATSLDGTTALKSGVSQWITGESARLDGHAWRGRSCAVLTGIGTVLQDDPRLDVRLPGTTRQPHLVVVDSDLSTPPSARLFEPAQDGLQRNVWIYHAAINQAKQTALAERGALLVYMPNSANKVDLAAMLHDLAQREVNELHVESGHKLNGSLLREGLVDEVLMYIGPKLLGQGAGMSTFGPLSQLQDGIQLQFTSVERLGEDLRIVARVKGSDAFLHD